MRRSIAVLALAGLSLAAGPSTDIGNPTGPGATEPNLAVASNGQVWMSWLEPVSSGGFAMKVSSFDGKRWATPGTVRAGTDFFVNWADFPSVQPLNGKRVAAHWLQRAGRGTYAYHVKVAFSNDGGVTWTPGTTAHTDTSASEHGFVTMWREGDRLGAAWLDGRKYAKNAGGHDDHNPSNEMMVASTMFDGRGRRGAESVLDGRACDCCQNSAAMTARGPIVAYRDRSPDEIRDIYVTRRVNGKWVEGKAVHADNWKIAACPVNGPAVAAEGNRAVVAWFTAARDSARVKVAFSSNAGETFAAPTRLDGGAPGGRVDVELLRDGSALVSWIERVGGDSAEVRVRRVSAEGRAGAPVTIATSSAARASGFPRMAVSGSDVYFAWTVPGRPSAVKLARRPVSDFR